MHKERIPMHKESGFLCRERGAREQAKRRGASRAGNAPQHTMACQGAAVKGNIPPGGILGFPRRGVGRGGSPCAEKAREAGLWTRGERTEKLLILY